MHDKKDGHEKAKKIDGDHMPFQGIRNDVVKQKSYKDKKHPIC